MTSSRTFSKRARVFLGLGSNIPDRRQYLYEGVCQLSRIPDVEIEAWSSLYLSEPKGVLAQPWFLNAVIMIKTSLSPLNLLRVCQRIERNLNRIPGEPQGPRTLDIDILLYDRLTYRDPYLQIPHPRIHERPFVLAPLCEVMPKIFHPNIGMPMDLLELSLVRLPGDLILFEDRGWYGQTSHHKVRDKE